MTVHIENEIKVLDVDVAKAEATLERLGFVRGADLSFRRYVYDIVPARASAWVRLRTDGTITTLTFKESIKDAVDGMKEIEVRVDNFDEINLLLIAMGHEPRSYQENSRTNYSGMNCTVSIDVWPRIPAYMEIESNNDNADDVLRCLETLAELVETETTSLDTQEVYKRYGIDLKGINDLRFESVV